MDTTSSLKPHEAMEAHEDGHDRSETSPTRTATGFNLMHHCDTIAKDIHLCTQDMKKPWIAYYYPPEEVARFGSSITTPWDRVSIYYNARRRWSHVVAQKSIQQGQVVTLHRVDYIMSVDQQSIYESESQSWIDRRGRKKHRFQALETTMKRDLIKCHGYMIANNDNHMQPMYAGQYIHDGYKLGFKRLKECLVMTNPYARLIEYKRILIDYYYHSIQRSNVVRTQYNYAPLMLYVATRDIDRGEQIFITQSHQRWILRYKMIDRAFLDALDHMIRFTTWFPIMLQHVKQGLDLDDARYQLNPEFLDHPMLNRLYEDQDSSAQPNDDDQDSSARLHDDHQDSSARLYDDDIQHQHEDDHPRASSVRVVLQHDSTTLS